MRDIVNIRKDVAFVLPLFITDNTRWVKVNRMLYELLSLN